jgi:hypothetical protein
MTPIRRIYADPIRENRRHPRSSAFDSLEHLLPMRPPHLIKAQAKPGLFHSPGRAGVGLNRLPLPANRLLEIAALGMGGGKGLHNRRFLVLGQLASLPGMDQSALAVARSFFMR